METTELHCLFEIVEVWSCWIIFPEFKMIVLNIKNMTGFAMVNMMVLLFIQYIGKDCTISETLYSIANLVIVTNRKKLLWILLVLGKYKPIWRAGTTINVFKDRDQVHEMVLFFIF